MYNYKDELDELVVRNIISAAAIAYGFMLLGQIFLDFSWNFESMMAMFTALITMYFARRQVAYDEKAIAHKVRNW